MQSNTGQSLEGKIAMVTGSARRIGRGIALGLADAGADIVVHGRESRDDAETVAEEVRSMGRNAMVVTGDISAESEVRRIFSEVDGKFAGIDILVNNAAVRAECPFLELTYSEWRRITGVILDGTFLCSREALRLMVPRRGGCVVNIGGVSAHVGAQQRAHVSAAKAGVVGITRALAVEFAGYNIRVNCVAPGQIGGSRSLDAGAPPKMPKNSAALLDRMGRLDEVAHMVRALCVPDGAFVTGQTVHVNGGMYMS